MERTLMGMEVKYNVYKVKGEGGEEGQREGR